MEFKNRNHSLIQLALSALAALSLFFACTRENNNGGGSQNNPEELTITGDALDVTDCSATLTGYANLPFELGDAEVGIMYDKVKSFEAAKKVVATGLDGNNKFTVTATGLEPSTTYFFKSYVQNGMAVKYGAVKSFTTQAQRVTRITLDKTSLSLLIGAEFTLSVTSILPDNANDKSYTWSSSDSAIASVDNSGKVTAKKTGNATIKATANDGSGVFASCAVRVKEPYTAVAGEAVDLGLSVKWSSTNLGATSPSDYGDYFAWGETEPKDNYSWATYKLCNGSSSTLTKYNNSSSYGIVDNKTEFKDYDYEDDAARQALGGKWRMPTDAEWTDLRTKCTWTWTTNYNGTGVEGRIVTASNGNSIFLPAAGYRYDTGLDDAGSVGYFWSSSLYTDGPFDAWAVYFGSGSVRGGSTYRFYGFSVRPVSE